MILGLFYQLTACKAVTLTQNNTERIFPQGLAQGVSGLEEAIFGHWSLKTAVDTQTGRMLEMERSFKDI